MEYPGEKTPGNQPSQPETDIPMNNTDIQNLILFVPLATKLVTPSKVYPHHV